MTIDELKQIHLFRQHLTNRVAKQAVVKDLNGLQSQFLINAFHALKIRCCDPITELDFGKGLVKNWTVRGTVHIFSSDDLPLFLHGKANYHCEEWPGIFSQYYNRQMVTPERHKFWAEHILHFVASGICGREEIKEQCIQIGMTDDELEAIFNPWGGCIRTLCERGFMNYVVQEKKAFACSPAFEPMETSDAELEIVTRYFRSYGPASIRDGAYYFGWSQSKLKSYMKQLPLRNISLNGIDYYYLDSLEADYPDIPEVIFLAGFDQLMLGYRKEESIFLPPEHLRGIFNLAGIVMPGILLNGRIVGKWQMKTGRLTLTLFEAISEDDRRHITRAAESLFTNIKKIVWA